MISDFRAGVYKHWHNIFKQKKHSASHKKVNSNKIKKTNSHDKNYIIINASTIN